MFSARRRRAEGWASSEKEKFAKANFSQSQQKFNTFLKGKNFIARPP